MARWPQTMAIFGSYLCSTGNASMSRVFKVGEIVLLKSGGPKMTVIDVGEILGEPGVTCAWFDDKNKKTNDTFPPDALELAEP